MKAREGTGSRQESGDIEGDIPVPATDRALGAT